MRARSLVLVLVLVAAACPRPRPELAAPPGDDSPRLYVELRIERAHERPLRDGARAGLARIPFVVLLPAHQGGDVELHVEAARVAVVGAETVCNIKILALRLPARDLYGMAEGNARASGTHARAGSACVEHLGERLIGGEVRALLHKRLDEKHEARSAAP